MKAKLHKMVSGYILSLNGDIDDPYAIVNEELAKDHEWHRLSLKNCEAIERGYDLDELAYEYDLDAIENVYGQVKAFKAGFQKALELMGDKKFSEEDMSKAIEIARNGSMQEQHNGYGRPTELRFVLDNLPSNDIIQSLQQTEWEVEIVEFTADDLKSINNEWHMLGELKLDADGCLILKRV